MNIYILYPLPTYIYIYLSINLYCIFISGGSSSSSQQQASNAAAPTSLSGIHILISKLMNLYITCKYIFVAAIKNINIAGICLKIHIILEYLYSTIHYVRLPVWHTHFFLQHVWVFLLVYLKLLLIINVVILVFVNAHSFINVLLKQNRASL